VGPAVLVVGRAHVLEQCSVLGIEVGNGFEEGSRSGDLSRGREVHDSLGGVDAVSDEIGPRLKIDRFFDGAKVEPCSQDVQGDARTVGGLPVVLRNRQRHVKGVLGIGDKRDQSAIAGVLDPVVDHSQRSEIGSQTGRQSRFGGVLLVRSSLREADEIGKEETRDYCADRRTRFGFDHSRLTITIRGLTQSFPSDVRG